MAAKCREDRGAPIAIAIQLQSMPLFDCALPGGTPDNRDWIRRKRNLVLRTSENSCGIGLTLAADCLGGANGPTAS